MAMATRTGRARFPRSISEDRRIGVETPTRGLSCRCHLPSVGRTRRSPIGWTGLVSGGSIIPLMDSVGRRTAPVVRVVTKIPGTQDVLNAGLTLQRRTAPGFRCGVARKLQATPPQMLRRPRKPILRRVLRSRMPNLVGGSFLSHRQAKSHSMKSGHRAKTTRLQRPIRRKTQRRRTNSIHRTEAQVRRSSARRGAVPLSRWRFATRSGCERRWKMETSTRKATSNSKRSTARTLSTRRLASPSSWESRSQRATKSQSRATSRRTKRFSSE